MLRAYDAAMHAPGPRLPPLAAGEWDDVLTRVLENSPGGTDEPMHIFTTLGRANPDLFRRWLGFGGALLNGSLPSRLRELVIVRTAARFGGRYEWAQHLALAQAAGVTDAELTALSGGDGDSEAGSLRALDAVGWSPLERAALRAVDETADDGAVSDATWEALDELLREDEVLELLMLIAHYLMLTTVLRSLRLPLEPRAEAVARQFPGGPADE